MKKFISLLLIFSLLALSVSNLFVSPALASSGTWSQTNWAGGSGQTSWSDSTKFSSSSSVTTGTANQVTISATEKLSNTGFDSNNTSWSVAAIPPSGWVEVAGNATFSTTNFLAMKYEAKCAATSDLTTGLTSPDTSSVNTYTDSTTPCTSANSRAVVSVASGYPIANISQTNSVTRCSTVTLNGNAAHLQTNNEWMTVARDGEAQAGNWTLGSVGSGYLFAGHNDNAPAKAGVASTTDTGDYRCAYTDTAGTTENPTSCPTNTASNTSGTAGNQVRILTLSNSAVIWDIAGNVWEWTNNIQSSAIDTTAGWVEWNSANIAAGALALYGPSSASYLAAAGMGRVYGGALNNGFLRGGTWDDGLSAGAFALNLNNTPSLTNYGVGFRCASDPVAISESFSSSSGRSSAGGNTVTIGSVTDGKIYQSVNVGDTSTYNISAYVYNNTAGSVGGTVDTNVAQLYYGGNTISSAAWTAVDGETGWYKLTGTITGVASSVEAGLLVKAGKTVKVDDISLSNYATSGTLTSSVFDSGQESNWGPVSSTVTTPSNTSASVTAAFSDDSSNMGTFSACTTSSCATNKRYAQYKITLSDTDYVSTPTFTNFSLPYSAYDSDAPTISLTALSPDPGTDSTPTLSGTATEETGTVSNVEYQMDGTSGSWTACTAGDGAFDEATETFSCTPSALSDGSHTMYVRATDSNSNTTSNASASTDTFTIDVTAPVSFDLDSPGHESYTGSERPTFKWKATTDATSGLSSYTLEVDNGSSGDFSISGIPTSKTTDYDMSKYLVHYDNFSDSDSTNNYISIYTKSSSSWGSSENDGKLKEGSVGWKIKAVDAAGNERSEGRTVIVDLTGPTLSSLSSSDSAGSKDSYLLVTNQKPNLTGTITDNYSPDKVEVSIYKENYFLGVETSKKLFTSLTYSLSNGANNKSLSFSIPVSDSLDYGSYEVNIKGADKAGNRSGASTIYLKVLTTQQAKELLQGKLSEKEKKTIQENAQVSLPKLEEAAKERRVKEAAELEKAMSPIAGMMRSFFASVSSVIPDLIGNLYKSSTAWISAFAGMTQEVAETTREGVKIAAGTVLRMTDLVLIKPFQNLSVSLDNSSNNVQQEIARVYKNMPPMVSVSQILRPAADIAIVVREEVGRRLKDGGQMLVRININTSVGFNNANTASSENVKRAINSYYAESSKTLRRGISSLAFGVGEKVQDVSDRAGFGIVQFGYLFVSEPTRIYDIQVATLSSTSVKISWRTNHPANGKVNYGLDETYPWDSQTSKRTTQHEFTLTGLTPNTEYHFEVMSQNKNYVYDANRRFTTPEK